MSLLRKQESIPVDSRFPACDTINIFAQFIGLMNTFSEGHHKEIVEKYEFGSRKLSSLQTGGQVVCVKK